MRKSLEQKVGRDKLDMCMSASHAVRCWEDPDRLAAGMSQGYMMHAVCLLSHPSLHVGAISQRSTMASLPYEKMKLDVWAASLKDNVTLSSCHFGQGLFRCRQGSLSPIGCWSRACRVELHRQSCMSLVQSWVSSVITWGQMGRGNQAQTSSTSFRRGCANAPWRLGIAGITTSRSRARCTFQVSTHQP